MATLISPAGTSLTVPDAVADDYIEQGYTDPAAPAEPDDSGDDVPRNSWTVQQLDGYAAAHDIAFDDGMKRAAKLAAIRQHLAG